MTINSFERWIFRTTRLSTLVAVLASWIGAVMMFVLGVAHTYDGFAALMFEDPTLYGDLPRGDATVVHLIGALDRFLIAVVLLYFGYGLYGLFVRPDRAPRDLGLPDWLHVESIGELKQTLAEVIIVILFVLFLRVALETFHADWLSLTLAGVAQILLLPVSIVLLAGALRLAELHPKARLRSRSHRSGDAAPRSPAE